MTIEAIQLTDTSAIRARRTDDGFLVDSPVIGRIGIQSYTQKDGSQLRVFRPKEEVFSPESLDSAKGKPITYSHVFVNPNNARTTVVGATSSAGYQDGEHVRIDVSVFAADAIESILLKRAQELSLGYTAEIHPTPGLYNPQTGEVVWKDDFDTRFPDGVITAEWQAFDAVQRHIRINHLAIVRRARAGRAARFNVDEDEDDMTVKVKIGDAEYDVPQEVKSQIEALQDSLTQEKAKKTTSETALQGLQAKIDAQQATIDGFDSRQEGLKKTWQAENKVRAELEVSAKQFGVACDSLSNKEIKIEMLKRAGAGDLSEKADAYIDAAFDIRKSTFGADASVFGLGDAFGSPMQTMSGVDPIDQAYQDSLNPPKEK